MTRILFVSFLLFLASKGYGQTYPQGYFRNPLGIPISLAGNFGECRPGHFHMGLDLKTEGRENLPVYAAADGYVSRIKTEPGGFGHAIYLTHPNGYTTVYAHLNDFFPALQKHLRSLQYARESWTVDETLKPEQFPVRKGQQIAWSGNTGGSTAPHLHFEIRDTKTERALNPQLFGFDIADHRAPVPTTVMVYELCQSFYSTVPRKVALRKVGEEYVADQPVSTGCPLGLGVIVNDYMDGSSNTLAFLTADLQVDGASVTRITLDDIGYDQTRYLHAYADYGTQRSSGQWTQLLFQLPGNDLSKIYAHNTATKGRIQGARTSDVRIILTDAARNSCTIRLQVQAGEASRTDSCNGPGEFRTTTSNPLIYSADPNMRFTLPAGSLYDESCLRPARTMTWAGGYSPSFRIGSSLVPVHKAFSLGIKPDVPVPFSLRQKLVLRYNDGKKTTGRVTEQEPGGWYTASVRAFGDYWLAADTSAPTLKPVGAIAGSLKGMKSIAFMATDAMTSVKSFRGEINGKWVLFEQHGDKWTYVFDERCPPGKHTLIVRATDEVGNETRRSFSFVR